MKEGYLEGEEELHSQVPVARLGDAGRRVDGGSRGVCVV